MASNRIIDAAAWRYYRFAMPYVLSVVRRKVDPQRAATLLASRSVMLCHLNRSGGNLLLRLMDQHTQINLWPYNFKIGRMMRGWNEDTWMLDSELTALGHSAPMLWRELAFDPRYYLFSRRAYTIKWDRFHEKKSYKLDLDIEDIYACFRYYLEDVYRSQVSVNRLVSSIFAAYQYGWKNSCGRDIASQRRANVFFSMNHESYFNHIERYLSTDADAKVVTLHREPYSWYASSKAIGKLQYDEDELRVLYSTQIEDIARAVGAHGDRILVIAFEDLLAKPRETMDQVADFCGLSRSETLYTPTFNGEPTRPNSSFPGDVGSAQAISTSAVSRRKYLDDKDLALVQSSGMLESYERLIDSLGSTNHARLNATRDASLPRASAGDRATAPTEQFAKGRTNA